MTVPIQNVDRHGTAADALEESLMPAANSMTTLMATVIIKTMMAKTNAISLSYLAAISAS